MSEEKNDQPANEQPEGVKKPKLIVPKKAPVNPFNNPKNNTRLSSKFGNSSAKGSGFKGGGVKKGK